MPSQYAPLTTYLAKSGKKVVELSFSEIERILGRTLPPSARTYQVWWANSGHYYAACWTGAGYRVQRPDLRNKIIRFVRIGNTRPRSASQPEVSRQRQAMPSQYAALAKYLAKSRKNIVELSFDDLERVLGRNLPSSARTYHAWWANSSYQATIWRTAGYLVRRPDLQNGVIRFVKSEDPSPRKTAHRDSPSRTDPGTSPFSRWQNLRSKWTVEKHLNSLDRNFVGYLEKCSERRIFSGPSTYFYARTIELVRNSANLAELARDKTFHELVYATLTSWGMHRMGESVAAKLTEFDVFSATLGTIVENVVHLSGCSIADLGDSEAESIAGSLSTLVGLPGLSASDAPLVANTKTLHFILPDLVPPIDRSYTGRFFFGPNKGLLLPGIPAENFLYMFSAFHRLAQRHGDALKAATGTSYLCLGHAKGLDNAVIGYVLTHPEQFPRPGRKNTPIED